MVKMSRQALAAWLAAALLPGCQGEDYRYPSDRCLEFIDTWCEQSAACVAPSERANNRETCEFSFKLQLDCSKIKELSSRFDGCIQTLRATTCEGYTKEMGLPYPDACKGILYNE